MDLIEQLREHLADSTLTRSERARASVRLARASEESGDYERARETMSEFWSRVGERPDLVGLDQTASAEVLLQVGALTSCIGSARQVEGAQAVAKDLISESIALFKALGDDTKAAEAQVDLAYCYWRQGEFDEARTLLQVALDHLPESSNEARAIALIRSVIVEISAARYNDALHILTNATAFFQAIGKDILEGKFHNQFAIALKNLGLAERREEYVDRALMEFTAASFHFERAGHERFCARVENNLAMLFCSVRRFVEAREHMERARKIFARLKDRGSVAQVDDTKARILLAEGRNSEAEKVARAAVHALEKGGEQSVLAEALTTQGTALARMGRHVRARLTLQRAALVAEQVGNLEGAGQAALTVVEELSEYLTPAELGDACEHAAALLAGSQHPGVKDRLLACSIRVLHMLATDHAGVEGHGAPPEWKGFSLRREMRRHERFLIEQALKEAGGVVTRASQLLGFKHHYSLISLINQRHRNLLRARSPVVPRKRSIMRGDAAPFQQTADRQQARPATILHAEDHRAAADAVRETLEAEGRRVETCADGASALKRIAGDAQYDLLLLADELPGIGGLELVRLARRLPHRRRTPVIMLSAAESETEAWRAGADAILRKSDDATAVAETVTRLLDSGTTGQ